MKWFSFLLAVPFLLLAGGLLLNRPSLFSPPGLVERLKTYLTTNVAETREGHLFPELRPPLFAAEAKETHDAVVAAMRSMRWQEIQTTETEVRAVVVSTLFRFRDDVIVWTEETENGTLLHARSSSRVGHADLAANTGHLKALFEKVSELTNKPDRHPQWRGTP